MPDLSLAAVCRRVAATLVFASAMTVVGLRPAEAQVQLTDDVLVKDGAVAPYLFGAEVQYFRARGGPGPNVAKADVEKLWDLLLDRVTQAHMNAVSLYIPWDFHEPVEGTYDFDGTLDRDGDGLPDYPSRNVRGFLAKVAAKGFKYIVIRPGPYINAEWGASGFGAVPTWMLVNHPETKTVGRRADTRATASFSSPVFRDQVKRWFTALHEQVLKDYIGPGKPVVFLQLDNETNFFWDSMYNVDFSPSAQASYHDFLSRSYGGDVKALNSAYGSAFASFAAVVPPTSPNDTTYPGFGWNYDWYNWHDTEIRDYYQFLRQTWEDLGVKEPNLLFSVCGSYNAFGQGLLPRLDMAQGGGLALSTLNIYPKTSGTQAQSTLNTPMKAAHDASLLAASHQQFYGAGGNWVMSTETVGGWFPNDAEMSLATRQHTYGALMGSSVKAMMIYYFHEGYNWDGREVLDSELAFDAPLDKAMQPRPAYALLQGLGQALAAGLGDKLRDAKPVRAPVLIAHDSWAQYPAINQVDGLQVASTESAAIYGLFRAAGALPNLAFVDQLSASDLAAYRLIVWDHPGYISSTTLAKFQAFVSGGGTLVVINDGRNDVAVVASGAAGHVVRLAQSPAAGWDGDGYTSLGAAATQSLAQAKGWLATAQVHPLVEIAAAGQEPFVHAWFSAAKADGSLLLFVENFQRSAMTVTVKPALTLTSTHSQWTLNPAVLASGGPLPQPQITSGQSLSTDGVKLPLSADGVDIWELTPTP